MRRFDGTLVLSAETYLHFFASQHNVGILLVQNDIAPDGVIIQVEADRE